MYVRPIAISAAGVWLGVWPTPAPAGPVPTPTPSECVGDCDNTGQVTVNEILEMVNIALGADSTTACAVGDANHDGMITVDEILQAVNLALTRCPLVGSAAGEAASGAGESTNDATDAAGRIVDFGKAAAGGAAAVVLARPNLAPAGGGAAFFSCPAGGKVTISSCVTDNQRSIVTLIFAECRAVDPQTQATTSRSGTLKLTVADVEVCASGVIPSGVQLSAEYTQFLVATTESTGPTTVQVTTLTDSFRPSGQGCGVVNGTDTIDGALTVQHDPAGPGAAFTYRNFVVQTSTLPTTATCITQRTLSGAFSVDDQTTGRRFSATAREFMITNEPVETQRVLTETGTLTVDCLGRAQFKTIEPLRTAPPAPCPISGVLEVTLPDGTVSQTRFTPNGVDFDFNGDGTIDKRATSCLGSSVAQCTDTSAAP